MAILEGDIKLLKSAVMADTSDGGGQMTGTAIVDGASNNLFPDTSEIDRALGRVNLRKVFGVAQTTNTDTLLGSHAIITDGPDDPLVNCLLLKSTAWSDERDDAKSVIERYLAKGPRFTCRLLDTHYAGSLQIRLYIQTGSTDFPVSGDAIVLRTPAGVEQYVRITKTSNSTQTYNVFEGGQSVSVTVTIATCDLGQALAYDFVGAPVARALANEATLYTSVYTTVPSAGASFYGIKTLGTSAVIGDVSAHVSGGIFSSLVPAATIETPITDQTPYQGRAAVVTTGAANVTLTSVSGTVGPDTVVKAPTAIEPGSITLVHGSSTFTDNGGQLFIGAVEVGTVNYRSGTITFLSSAPSYGSATNTLTYKPASAASASAFSSELLITSANRGLAFTNVFEPVPAPGSFTLSYMAQGRWYTLTDNGSGKLSGSDTSYGVGTISYTTGSMAVTLGAIPDVDSALIADWGDPSSASAISTNLPTKLNRTLDFASGTVASSLVVTWSNGATNYTASTNSAGVLTGDATGRFMGGQLVFEPNVFPSGNISVASTKAPTASTAYSGSGLVVTLTNAPVAPGSFKGVLTVSSFPSNAYPLPGQPVVYDRDGLLYTNIRQTGYVDGANPNVGLTPVAIGTINYTTGVVTAYANVTVPLWVHTPVTTTSMWGNYTYLRWSLSNESVTFNAIGVSSYSYGTWGAQSDTFTPDAYQMTVGTSTRDTVVTSDMLFKVGGDFYSAQSGVVRQGWNIVSGAPSVLSAGSATNVGIISLSTLPSNNANSVTWYNVAQDKAGRSVNHGVFRTASAPLKIGVFQLIDGSSVGNGGDGGAITGAFTGTIDYVRGIVRWNGTVADVGNIRYNAVFLQYLPLDGSLLGLETARLPLDGKVPIYRSGGIVIIHNTQTYSLPNPLVKPTVYDVGRVRVAAMKVKTATGVTVDTSLYTTNLDAGTIFFPTGSDLTGLAQPFTVEHRIEDVMLCSIADISGQLTFTRALTHNFPSGTSYISSALVSGDVFARAYNHTEQSTWTNVWSDALIGTAPTANFNEAVNPLVVTNAGAITERWACIFTNTTTFRIVGESVGEIASGNTGTTCAPLNPATGVPYFSIPAAGWGSGWATGNVYRFNTAACGTPFWVVRTVLQGPATLQDDKFTLAFRGDVDRP